MLKRIKNCIKVLLGRPTEREAYLAWEVGDLEKRYDHTLELRADCMVEKAELEHKLKKAKREIEFKESQNQLLREKLGD
ncbi:MAG: hypothetical protein R3254_08860 [Thiomicrorhabdus sp.]|nr:hypothetical protein [Thiomicrorhabdus sp.]